MARGRIIDRSDLSAYRAPESAGSGSEPGSPEFRVEEAVRAGFAQGLARGRAEAQAALDAELGRARESIAASLGELHTLRQQMIDENRAALLELATVIAGRIVRARVDAGDPVAVRVAEEVLGALPAKPGRKVRVSPDDHGTISETIAALGESAVGIEIVPDPAISSGGLIVEEPEEVIDARLETSLASLGDALDEER